MIRQFNEMMSLYGSEQNLLIYQMGKVGSSSIEKCLGRAINIHTLFGNSVCPPHYNILRQGLWGWVRYQFPYVLKRRALLSRPTLKIVTLVRDPVARNRSMFFQDLYHWLSSFVRENNLTGKTDGIELLLECYRDHFNHHYYDQWFDKELYPFTGIDIFSQPYVVGKHSVFSRSNVEVFLVRLEDLSDNWSALEEFLGEKLPRIRTNVSKNKWYGNLYQEFLEVCPLLEEERLLYQGKTARHFGYARASS